MLMEIEEGITTCLNNINMWENYINTNIVKERLLKDILRLIKRQYKHIAYLERYNNKYERKDTRYI